jgi:zinc transport system permease protein
VRHAHLPSIATTTIIATTWPASRPGMSAVIEPFLIRAMAAAVGLAIVAAPLGCVVVWSRMAYFGETVAQASLIGIALGLLLHLDLTASALAVAIAISALLILLSRQRLVPLDSILGMLAHAALAAGVIAASLVRGPSLDLMGYLFGDIFAVSDSDLMWVYGGGIVLLAALAWLWQPLLALAVHEELAAAEGVAREWVKAAFVLLLALAIAVAMKIVGILLAIAFLIMPAVAARPLAGTPETMAVLAAVIAAVGVLAGLALSFSYDVPGGPSIVVVLAALAGASLAATALRMARS